MERILYGLRLNLPSTTPNKAILAAATTTTKTNKAQFAALHDPPQAQWLGKTHLQREQTLSSWLSDVPSMPVKWNALNAATQSSGTKFTTIPSGKRPVCTSCHHTS
jgi:hypothetical protein